MQTEQIDTIIRAVRAFQRSTERVATQDRGHTPTVIAQYHRLYDRVRDTLPDDVYISSLQLEPEPELAPAIQLNRVAFATQQIATYLSSITEDA